MSSGDLTNTVLPSKRGSGGGLRFAKQALSAMAWLSAGLFAVYIVARYGAPMHSGLLDAWNRDLPRLYEPGTPLASSAVGLHFLGGAILLLLGPLQFVSAIRERVPAVHRWIGRIYAASALLAGLGGLTFIALKGTIGGTPMNIGFGLYGVLTVIAAVMTPLYAWRRQFDRHRAWAIRLFALVIGSWLFRMDYGFWKIVTNGLGHTPNFTGPFDVVMAYFFFIPNLIVAEIIIRVPAFRAPAAMRAIAAATLGVAALIIGVGTYYFTRYHWGPDILALFGWTL